MKSEAAFSPDWLSPPGETIAGVLRSRHLDLSEFASELGESLPWTESLLHGGIPITMNLSERISAVIGPSKDFWARCEAAYRGSLASVQSDISKNPISAWMLNLPVDDMLSYGWLSEFNPSEGREIACLRYFGVQSVESWHAGYKALLNRIAFKSTTAYTSHPESVIAWLREGELQSRAFTCRPWSPDVFKSLLIEIRSLTRERDPSLFLPELQSKCAKAGVAVLVVRLPKGCHASGAARFLSPDRALIQLSMRYLSDDHFWFSFFHEAAHLLLHENGLLFVDSDEGMTRSTDSEESEANRFAEQVLISDQLRQQMLDLPANGRSIARFAKDIGVSPGIVVGQLQHSGRIKPNHFNSLKTYFEWK